MFVHKKTEEEIAREWLLIFLENVLKGDERYQKLVQPVVKEARELVLGYKDYYSISRSYYINIIWLRNKMPEFLIKLNPENLTIQDYQDIYNKLVE